MPTRTPTSRDYSILIALTILASVAARNDDDYIGAVPTLADSSGGNQLSWDPAPEPDFQYYHIYRGTDPDFVHGPGNLMRSTRTYPTAATAWPAACTSIG